MAENEIPDAAIDRAAAIIQRAIDAAKAPLQAEIDRLRQAHWDARAAWGMDNDGQPTPAALTSDFCALIRDDWQIAKEYLDDARAEGAK